jgi:phosphoenolpyruvate carboxylase
LVWSDQDHEVAFLIGRLDAIIREQAGEGIFHKLHQIRDLAIAARQHEDHASLKAKRALINRLRVKEAYAIAHAFSLFFQLVNFCEERARRRHLASHPAPRTEAASALPSRAKSSPSSIRILPSRNVISSN